MKINIKATKIVLSPRLKDYIQKKMDMLDKYLGNIQVLNCDVEVALITKHHNKGEIYQAEINLEVPRKLLRVQKTEKVLFKAIDKTKDHLVRSIRRYKEKMIDKKKRGR